MRTQTSKTNAAYYTWGGNCDGWRLVANEGLSVIEEIVPPGSQEVRHYHRHATQFFYILSGVATIEVEGINHVVEAGSGLEVSPNEKHTFMNLSGETVAFLVISSPSTKGDRFECQK